MSTSSKATERLAELDRAVEAAASRWDGARQAAARDPWTRVRDVLQPLRDYSEGVRYRKRDADADEEERLVAELLARVEAEGLTLRPMAAGNPGVLEVHDPKPDHEAAEAHQELRAAKSERDAFAREHADEIEAEANRAEMERLRDALAGDDPEAVRAALA